MKGALRSKTILGGLLALLAPLLGISLSDLCSADALDTATRLAGAVGAVLAIYGRLRADTAITGLWQSPGER